MSPATPEPQEAIASACPQGTVLGFDFGEKRIGVSIGETLIKTAHPLTTIVQEKRDERFAAIGKIIAEWTPVLLVVGRPLHSDGTPHELTQRSDRFANQLHGRFGLPVARADERYTSLDAEARLHEIGLNSRQARGLTDAVAAQLILQAWFDAPVPPTG